MQLYKIDVAQIEEWQTINNKHALDRVFREAKSTIVNGEAVWLMRHTGATLEKFDELTTLEALADYKKSVYKYL